MRSSLPSGKYYSAPRALATCAGAAAVLPGGGLHARETRAAYAPTEPGEH